MSETGRSETTQKFVLWSKRGKSPREGSVLDIDTGILRRDHVLMLRSPQAEITLGLGAKAGAFMDFAANGETRGDPLLDACREADESIAGGDLAKSLALGVPDVITTIENRARRRLALVECFLGKASPDDPEHPGYPAGAPDDEGGEFMPKDQTEQAKEETVQELRRTNARREFFTAARALLIMLGSLPVDAIPGPDIASATATLIELGQAAIELHNDEVEIDFAIDFIKNGPYDLETLRAGNSFESFSSFDDFKKASLIPAEVWKRFGGIPGTQFHHLVEQGGANEQNFTPEQLHNTDNIISLPKMIHEVVNGEYSAKSSDDPSLTMREWLQKQPYDKQRAYAIETLQKLGILKK